MKTIISTMSQTRFYLKTSIMSTSSQTQKQTSILSFNCSVANGKQYLETLQNPVQIMPQTLKIPTDSFIATFPRISRDSRIESTRRSGNDPEHFGADSSIIHTSYITTPFISLSSEDKWNRAVYNLRQYCKLCKHIGFKRLLVHLPRNEKELLNLGNGMDLLSRMCNAYDFVTLLLEVPYITCCLKKTTETVSNDSVEYLRNYFENVVQFFDRFHNGNVELCFDTAHLYSNGLDGDDIVRLLETTVNNKRLLDYCNVIHLNGNERPKYTSDKHVPIFSEKNRMKKWSDLVKYLADKHKILIAENTTNPSRYEDWKRFADEYGLQIIDSIPELGV